MIVVTFDRWDYELEPAEVRLVRDFAAEVIARRNVDRRKDPSAERAADELGRQAREFGAEFAVCHMFGVPFDRTVHLGGDGGFDFIWRDWKVDVKYVNYRPPGAALIIPADCRSLDNADVVAFATEYVHGQHWYQAHGVISIDRFRRHPKTVWVDEKHPHHKVTGNNDCWVLDVVKKHLKPMDGFYNIEPKGAHSGQVAPNTTTP